MLKNNQTKCRCGVSVKTLDDVAKNGILVTRGHGTKWEPEFQCKKCGANWGRIK